MDTANTETLNLFEIVVLSSLSGREGFLAGDLIAVADHGSEQANREAAKAVLRLSRAVGSAPSS